ncbi:hypothetical protein AGMMS49975_26370 [Clostridia bacterium]|nr:hypothetical protein AGMMS49975_26370 [Clostridia bacterium]
MDTTFETGDAMAFKYLRMEQHILQDAREKNRSYATASRG